MHCSQSSPMPSTLNMHKPVCFICPTNRIGYFERRINTGRNNMIIQDPLRQMHLMQRPGTDLLEVYCSADSQLTHQANCSGLHARRFGFERRGSSCTFAGRNRLYDMLWNLRPSQIWVSPRCGPWSNWNRLNMSKSTVLAEQILGRPEI